MTNTIHCLHNLYQMLERYPKHLAFKDKTHELSYQELNDYCVSMAMQLTAMGVKPQQRVVLLCDKSTEQIIFYYTLLTLGCTAVIHRPIKHHADWCFIINDIEPHWVLSQYHHVHKKWGNSVYTIKVTQGHCELYPPTKLYSISNGAMLANYQCQTTADDLAMIIYTSGSSAKPKGVMLTHRNLCVARDAISNYLNMHHQNTILSTLAFWFDYGLYQSYLCFSVGATLIQMKNMVFHHQFFDYLKHQPIDFLPLTSNLIQIIAQTCPQIPSTFNNVQTITSTGSPLYKKHVLMLQKLFPNASIYAMYGLTECKRCAYLPPAQLKRIIAQDQSIPLGIPMPNTHMTIVDQSYHIITRPHQIGEITIQGEHVMAGYWRRPKTNANTIKPHPLTGKRTLYTGDLAYINEHGHLCHVGRKDDVFKCKGVRISPRYIEEHLCNAFAITDICVFGVPTPLGDHHIVVHLHAPDHTEQDALQLYCLAHLPPSHQPSMWCFRTSLPKLSNGKIDRKNIVKQHLEKRPSSQPKSFTQA